MKSTPSNTVPESISVQVENQNPSIHATSNEVDISITSPGFATRGGRCCVVPFAARRFDRAIFCGVVGDFIGNGTHSSRSKAVSSEVIGAAASPMSSSHLDTSCASDIVNNAALFPGGF